MKRVGKSLKLRQMILTSIIFGALAGAFSSSGSFTQTAFSQGYGNTGSCTDQMPGGGTYCAAIYCYKCYACSTGTCKYMRTQGTGTCPSPSC